MFSRHNIIVITDNITYTSKHFMYLVSHKNVLSIIKLTCKTYTKEKILSILYLHRSCNYYFPCCVYVNCSILILK